ncbi:unnamed protein product [Onchocerca ochengi]|uniref:ALMS_motif domain-containing protein n=1 Tax=Onchocerca ochengi TaxID=42157 RepID=A0A182ECG2_ONCOC|nr:unnamed protein product [Onchocerca ochengi]
MGYYGTRTGSSSQLAILTPNQRENIIRKERERRRLIRHVGCFTYNCISIHFMSCEICIILRLINVYLSYQQVRQLSAENAAKIRERVKIAKQKKMEELRKRITDAIVQRNHLTSSGVLSPVHIDSNTLPTETPRRSRRSQITREELARAVHRHREALSRLRRENEREQRRRELILERRRKAREVANVRSRRI